MSKSGRETEKDPRRQKKQSDITVEEMEGRK
jgi:hypothetical protein